MNSFHLVPNGTPPFYLAESSAWEDEAHASFSLEQTCSEQRRRLHLLRLLSSYLAARAGSRRRQDIAKEQRALQDLYETVWCELEDVLTTARIHHIRKIIELERADSISQG